jgi:hypothetical protein
MKKDVLWWECNDTIVTSKTRQQVKDTQAYLLFYKRWDPKVEELRRIVTSDEEERSDSVMVSEIWWQLFLASATPGPLTTKPISCEHGGMSFI